MIEDPSALLKVTQVPRQVRDGISAFCRVNGIEQRHAIEFLFDLLYDPRNLEAVSKRLERSLAKWDPDLYRRLGPWRARRHELGFYGVWVRIPENGTANGELNDASASQTPP